MNLTGADPGRAAATASNNNNNMVASTTAAGSSSSSNNNNNNNTSGSGHHNKRRNSTSDDDSGCPLEEFAWVPPGLPPEQSLRGRGWAVFDTSPIDLYRRVLDSYITMTPYLRHDDLDPVLRSPQSLHHSDDC
ncbi:protein prickle [Elysia marginata]|uniref:Protein prickle n=1 Tax=Elysia marginata TaxID=1093978 RepID=A0AAV4J9R7_9GAST|nr:protein prickle [Elysia marginata]